MLNPKTALTVKHDNNSTFATYTDEAQDYFRNEFTLDMVSADDFLYIGFEKPINAFYVALKTANTAANTLTLKYWNGTSWTAPSGYNDDTKGFTRDGFIQWNRNQQDTDSVNDEAEKTIDSVEKYWYQVSVSVDWDVGTEIWGINLVFVDDEDLKEEFPSITDSSFFTDSSTNHLRTHVAVRNEIVQRLRNKDYKKLESTNSNAQTNLTQWDLLEVEEVREAAKFFALSKIFFNISDSPDDSYNMKSAMYEQWGQERLRLARISIDSDNDGIADSNEKLQMFSSRRITR